MYLMQHADNIICLDIQYIQIIANNIDCHSRRRTRKGFVYAHRQKTTDRKTGPNEPVKRFANAGINLSGSLPIHLIQINLKLAGMWSIRVLIQRGASDSLSNRTDFGKLTKFFCNLSA
ncbi:hypothetical protein KOEU_38290 [Komagataeibacter europaeus]|uniref:Uncharacterized protein n=1 Tax=Komagataeibacter europaeus TaxID=33995 RepID=A0A0M0ECJ0_KOMEU|nr:hypothetical protein KOEU_38290 [Komagataeibacter europaeus]